MEEISKEPEGLDIRYTLLTDAPYLSDWLHDKEVQRWFPVCEERELTDAIQCWMGFSRYSSSLTATLDEGKTVCGIATLFLMPYRKISHQAIFKMVVAPQFQHQGIGTSLLKNLKHLARNYFRLQLMHIEVFEKNPLISLLKKSGFHEFARQEKYFKDEEQYFARVLYEALL